MHTCLHKANLTNRQTDRQKYKQSYTRQTQQTIIHTLRNTTNTEVFVRYLIFSQQSMKHFCLFNDDDDDNCRVTSCMKLQVEF